MYSIGIAYILWLLSGFGALGFHRFYLGKIGTGLIYVLTGGLFGIGSVYDLVTLPLQVREANLRLGYHQAMWDRTIRDVGGGSVASADSGFSGGNGSSGAGTRNRKKDTVEKSILRTAKANGGIVTPPEIALESDCSIDEAKKALDKLVEKDYAELRVNKNGGLVYFFKEFSKDGTHPDLEDF